MKRFTLIVLTTASVVGCQSPVNKWDGRSPQFSRYPTGGKAPAGGHVAANQGQAAPTVGPNGEIQQVGYNHGHGAIQNRSFRQRVGVAVESHGGGLPGVPGVGGPVMGAPGVPGGGPGMMAGGPGMPGGMSMGGGGGGFTGGPNCPPGMMGPGMMGGIPMGPRFSTGRTQIRFVQPTGMKIAWQSMEVHQPDGFTPPQLEVPARYNFHQARIYRLKLTEIPNRAGLELYPTLEVYPGNMKIDAYLSHNAVPIEVTDEDFDQVQAGNYVTKVIYLPDPKYQELAIAGVETLVSTRLDPGVDPVQEAHRRGSILAVLRIGSVDLEMPHSPPLFPTAQAMGPLPPGFPMTPENAVPGPSNMMPPPNPSAAPNPDTVPVPAPNPAPFSGAEGQEEGAGQVSLTPIQ